QVARGAAQRQPEADQGDPTLEPGAGTMQDDHRDERRAPHQHQQGAGAVAPTDARSILNAPQSQDRTPREATPRQASPHDPLAPLIEQQEQGARSQQLRHRRVSAYTFVGLSVTIAAIQGSALFLNVTAIEPALGSSLSSEMLPDSSSCYATPSPAVPAPPTKTAAPNTSSPVFTGFGPTLALAVIPEVKNAWPTGESASTF